MTKLKLYRPLFPFYITQGFGKDKTDPQYLEAYKRIGCIGHPGLDCIRQTALTEGAYVRAACEGTVTFTGDDENGAYIVVIITDNKYEYEGSETHFKHIYVHVAPKIPVRVGDKVKTGDIIAYASHTGDNVKPHLHFALKPVTQAEKSWQWAVINPNNGYQGCIDPEPYLEKLSAWEFIQPVEAEKPAAKLAEKPTPVSLVEKKIFLIQQLLNLYEKLISLLRDNAHSFGAARSPSWRIFRKVNIKKNCEACGTNKKLELHHIQPFHLDFSLELSVNNVITLCRRCHQLLGHLDDFHSKNINVREDAEVWKNKIINRPL